MVTTFAKKNVNYFTWSEISIATAVVIDIVLTQKINFIVHILNHVMFHPVPHCSMLFIYRKNIFQKSCDTVTMNSNFAIL